MDYGQELRVEEAQLVRLRELQFEIQRRIKLIERRIEALRILETSSEFGATFDLNSLSSSGEISLLQIKLPSQTRNSKNPEARDQRFGELLSALARKEIIARGPQTIEQLIELIPPDQRTEFDARGETQSLGFRVRRVFRRSQDFEVDRKTSRVSYVGSLEEGEVPIISRLVVGPETVEAVVVDFDGRENEIPIEQFSKDVLSGRLFGVRGPDRISSVVFVDGFYRSVHRGETNEDMRNVPRERRGKA